MPDELMDEEHDHTVAAMHHVVGSEEWTRLSGTGAAARGRSRRMRRTRYAATAGSAVAVTGVAVLVASTFGGGGGTSAAAPAGGVTHHSSPAPAVSSPAPAVPRSPAKTTPSQQTMASYYDKWKTCAVENLTAGPDYPGAVAPPATTKAWVDACHRMVGALSALNPAADVSPAPSGWRIPDVHTTPPTGELGRDDPVPAHATPTVGPAEYRIEDAKGTIVLAFHSSGGHDGDHRADAVPVAMVDGLRAWFSGPSSAGQLTNPAEFYVAKANGPGDAYVLLLSAPSTYTTEDFKALVTSPGFEQMMAGNLAEPGF